MLLIPGRTLMITRVIRTNAFWKLYAARSIHRLLIRTNFYEKWQRSDFGKFFIFKQKGEAGERDLLAHVTELQNTGIDSVTWETMETRKLDALRTPISWALSLSVSTFSLLPNTPNRIFQQSRSMARGYSRLCILSRSRMKLYLSDSLRKLPALHPEASMWACTPCIYRNHQRLGLLSWAKGETAEQPSSWEGWILLLPLWS